MKKKIRLFALLAAWALLAAGCVPPPPVTRPTETQAVSRPTTEPTQASSSTVPTETTTPNPVVTEPEAEEFILSFAGDCTFGDNFDAEEASGTFCKVVKDRYDYPLANVKTWFETDDYSFVNLECALTESDPTEEEMEELMDHRFRFRGPLEYAKIFSGSGVEFASCANNHSRDYGRQGLLDTWAALEAENLQYASFGKSCVVTTESGLTLGICAAFFSFGQKEIENTVKRLRDQGAELVVMSIHWGDEGTYSPNEQQQTLGHMAIDAGVDIVYGHHSHTLQRIEPYRGGVIYYSLGNFSFGGNRNPTDKDTAVVRQQILRYEDGTVALGDLEIVPCRISSVPNWNDYRPTPYETGDPGYDRVMAKLEGSYDGKDLLVSYEPMPTEGN